MRTRRILCAVGALTLILAGVSCTAALQPTPSPEPTSTPTPRAMTFEGSSCPEDFQDDRTVTRELEISPGSHLTLTLGATPSTPCGWQTLEIGDSTVLEQVAHRRNWPAEGVTPVPGAPGTEVWGLEVLEPGETAVSVACVCLGEEGEEDVLRGRFVLDVTVR